MNTNRCARNAIATCAAATSALTPAFATSASAQSWPDRDIHSICMFPPGSGADIVVRTLKRAGHTKIFTLSGNHIMSLFDAAIDSKLELFHVRHEAATVHMADAFGRLDLIDRRHCDAFGYGCAEAFEDLLGLIFVNVHGGTVATAAGRVAGLIGPTPSQVQPSTGPL